MNLKKFIFILLIFSVCLVLTKPVHPNKRMSRRRYTHKRRPKIQPIQYRPRYTSDQLTILSEYADSIPDPTSKNNFLNHLFKNNLQLTNCVSLTCSNGKCQAIRNSQTKSIKEFCSCDKNYTGRNCNYSHFRKKKSDNHEMQKK